LEATDPLPAGTLASARIRHVGMVDAGEVPSYLAAMDVLALPTYREGFPNVLLEAAAMERPVVATRVTGCPDAVVDGVTGTLVPPRDPAALAAALAAYVADPALRREHGRAARRHVLARFAPEAIWDAQAAVYARLLGRRGDRVKR